MTGKAIEVFVKAQPFEPFVLVLSSGDRYRIDHPENCMLLLDRIVVALGTSKKKDERPDDMALLSYLHIAAAEPANKTKTR